MRKKKLEMILSRLPDLSTPRPDLEQYRTPPSICADILYYAYARGDVRDREVADLGCGNGIFSLGSYLLGAHRVLGMDIDQNAVDRARGNLGEIASIYPGKEDQSAPEFIRMDVRSITEGLFRFDTVFMNPPFGSQKRHADRPFIEKAALISDVVYTIHNSSTMEFIRRLIRSVGGEIVQELDYEMDIPHRFEFHTREKDTIEVTMVVFEVRV